MVRKRNEIWEIFFFAGQGSLLAFTLQMSHLFKANSLFICWCCLETNCLKSHIFFSVCWQISTKVTDKSVSTSGKEGGGCTNV